MRECTIIASTSQRGCWAAMDASTLISDASALVSAASALFSAALAAVSAVLPPRFVSFHNARVDTHRPPVKIARMAVKSISKASVIFTMRPLQRGMYSFGSVFLALACSDVAGAWTSGFTVDAGAACAFEVAPVFAADAGESTSSDCPNAMFGTGVTVADVAVGGAGAAKVVVDASSMTMGKARFKIKSPLSSKCRGARRKAALEGFDELNGRSDVVNDEQGFVPVQKRIVVRKALLITHRSDAFEQGYAALQNPIRCIAFKVPGRPKLFHMLAH